MNGRGVSERPGLSHAHCPAPRPPHDEVGGLAQHQISVVMRRGHVWRMRLVPDIAAVAQRHSVVGFDRERAVVA